MATKLTKALSDREDGLTFDAENVTVGEYLDRWLKDNVEGNVGPRTLSNYQLQVRQHIRPALGRIKLKSSPLPTYRPCTARNSIPASPLRAFATSTLSCTGP